MRRVRSAACVVMMLTVATTTGGAASATTVPALSTDKAQLDCPTRLFGITSDGHFIIRDTDDAEIRADKLTHDALPTAYNALGFFGSTAVKNGVIDRFTAISPTHGPQILSVKDEKNAPDLTFTTVNMRNAQFKARLYTTSGGYYVFTVDESGTMKRWGTYRSSQGKIYFAKPRIVTTNAGDLETLEYIARRSYHDVKKDVFVATTADGALVQIRVPVDAPAKASFLTVKGRGFDDVSAISLGDCNNHLSYLSVLAIDASGNTATWWTLKNQFAPRASNLRDRGAVGGGADWTLHATI